jgi:hypothetical protein
MTIPIILEENGDTTSDVENEEKEKEEEEEEEEEEGDSS